MIELLLALGIYLGSPAAPAADYELPDFGTSGFSGYTLEAEPEIEVVEEAAVEQREPTAPSRSHTRELPEHEPVVEVSEPDPVVASPPPPTGGILDVAAAYVGSPYVLMGTPPAAFDCSAFTWWVYRQAGINIPRSVNGQAAAVTPVSNPRPGDLVFYNDYHHVGIYAGNGMTYEALNPSSGVRYGAMVSDNVWYGRP